MFEDKYYLKLSNTILIDIIKLKQTTKLRYHKKAI